MAMRRFFLLSLAMVLAASCARAEPACRQTTFEEARYAVCEFPESADIRLFLNDASGAPFGEFDALKSAVEAKGETLLFAMNAGMYRQDRSPVGLYVENGETARGVNQAECDGNFCLKPNGVFWVSNKRAYVAEAGAYLTRAPKTGAQYATQSGPMLVIDGAIHPKFNPASESRKYRNGVGLRTMEKGENRIVFVISDTPVTFHAFARYFRDELKTENALYLDGSISRFFAPEIDRDDDGARMGPIVGVVATSKESRP
jgi:uncharacterized protein YigE (DUF2233 family)